MWNLRTTAAAVGLGVAFLSATLPGSAAAQIDYRNLDDERPVSTEDAYPIERHAFELLGAYRFERDRQGERVHLFPAELAFGLLDNAQVGVKAPVAGVAPSAGADTDWGLAQVGLFALYNFNTESPSLPALSLRVDAGLPIGSLAGETTRFSVKAIATRSWGPSRFHANAIRSFGAEDGLGTVEVAPRWQYSLAVDHTLYRQSVLLIGEIAAARASGAAPVEWHAALGARYQWTPTFVLDVGIARRLRESIGPDYALTLGISHAFGLSWLMPSSGR